MDELIGLANEIRELWYAPDPVAYTRLMKQLDEGYLETQRIYLTVDLAAMISATIEVPVQRLDSDTVLYYEMKGVNTLNDLKRKFAEHEKVPFHEVGHMLVESDVMYKDQLISGPSSILVDPYTKLSTLGKRKVVMFPLPASDHHLSWTEVDDRIIEVNDQQSEHTLPIKINATTTVGQLKKKLWFTLGAAPAEQIIRTNTSERLELEDTHVLGNEDSVRLYIKSYPLDVRLYGFIINTWRIGINVLDNGDSLATKIMADDIIGDTMVDQLWLGTPIIAEQQNITDEPNILYLIAQHPDKRVYADTSLASRED